MSTNALDALTSLPSISGWTVIADRSILVYWWEPPGNRELRVLDLDTHDTSSIPLDDLEIDLDTWKGLSWHEGLQRLVVPTRKTNHMLDFDGSVEPLVDVDHHFVVHGIAPDGDRVLYVDYEGDWTLRLHDRTTGESWHVSDDPEQGGHAGFDPDGEQIAFRRNSSNEFGQGTIVLADHDGETIREFNVADPDSRTLLECWHPDGDRLFVSDRSKDTYRVGSYDVDAEQVTWFGPTDDIERGVSIDRDGRRTLVARQRDDAQVQVLYELDAPRSGRELDVPTGWTSGGAFLSDQEVILQRSTPTRPTRLLRYDLETDEAVTLVDTATDAIDSLTLSEAEFVQYDSADGTQVNALLYDSGARPSAAVVHVHGGPTTFANRSFDPAVQYLTTRGYTVLRPNYRGSTDQGRTYERSIRGELGRGEVDDVAAGARWLAGKSWIDGDRIGLYGHSHGAYNATMAAIRHPDVWQVVIPDNGCYDAVAVYGDPNPYSQRRLLGEEEKDESEEYFREISPVHRAEYVGCPLCVVHGGDDEGGLAQVEAFVEALEERGSTEGEQFRVEVFDGEGHVIENKKALWSLLDEVLTEHL